MQASPATTTDGRSGRALCEKRSLSHGLSYGWRTPLQCGWRISSCLSSPPCLFFHVTCCSASNGGNGRANALSVHAKYIVKILGFELAGIVRRHYSCARLVLVPPHIWNPTTPRAHYSPFIFCTCNIQNACEKAITATPTKFQNLYLQIFCPVLTLLSSLRCDKLPFVHFKWRFKLSRPYVFWINEVILKSYRSRHTYLYFR